MIESRTALAVGGVPHQCPSAVEGRKKTLLPLQMFHSASSSSSSSSSCMGSSPPATFSNSPVSEFHIHLICTLNSAISMPKSFYGANLKRSDKCNTALGVSLKWFVVIQELTRTRACSGVSTSPFLQTECSFSSVTTPFEQHMIENGIQHPIGFSFKRPVKGSMEIREFPLLH